MAQKAIIQRSLDVGRDVGQKTQDRLESLVADLVRLSEEQAEQARNLVTELVERSRTTSEQMVESVDREVRNQIANLGLATQADIRRLERKIEALGSSSTRKASAKRAAKRPAKKVSASKASAKKASAKKASTSGR